MLSCDRLTLAFFLCSAASVSRSAVPTILSALICYNSITYCIFVLLNMIVLLNVINRTKIGKNTLGLILLALYSLRWRSKWICFVCVFDIILSAHFGCNGNHFGRGGKWLREQSLIEATTSNSNISKQKKPLPSNQIEIYAFKTNEYCCHVCKPWPNVLRTKTTATRECNSITSDDEQ